MSYTVLRRSLLAALILFLLALAEAFVITILLSGKVFAHEAPPSEISVEIAPGDQFQLQVSVDLIAATERLGLVRQETGAFDNAKLQVISDRIVETLAISQDGRPVDIRMDAARIEDAETGVFSLSFAGSTASGTVSITPGPAVGDSLLRFPPRPVRYVSEAETAVFTPGVVTPSSAQVFVEYVKAGFVHIVPMGLDHILFVVGLFLLSLNLRTLIMQVSLFTLAHSVTLALGALGYVKIPSAIVEPLIAASIVFIAVENIVARDLSRWRPVVVFAFGLLHGLGFASVLADFGLPDAEFVTAIVGFNAGVELGQLFVLALCFAAVGYWFSAMRWYRSRITIPASVAVGATGLVWTIEWVGAAL